MFQDKMIIEFKVNDYISLKLEKNETIIYVSGERFNQCKYLLLDVKINEIQNYDDIKSIDEAEKILDASREFVKKSKITPDQEFWAHCSNLQAWCENEYDTRLLHRNLSFPLLKTLVEVGDQKAKKVFKDEIAKRIESGAISVIIYLFKEGYMNFLNEEEQDVVLLDLNNKVSENFGKYIDESFDLKNTRLIKEATYGLGRLYKSGVLSIKKILQERIRTKINNSTINELFKFLEQFDFGTVGKDAYRDLSLGLDPIFNTKLNALLDSENENDVEYGIYLLKMLIKKGDISLKNKIKELLSKKLEKANISRVKHYLLCGFLTHLEEKELELTLFSSNSRFRKTLIEEIDKEMEHFLNERYDNTPFLKEHALLLLKHLAELNIPTAKTLIRSYASKIIKAGRLRCISYFLSRGYMNYFDKGTIKTLFLQNRQIFLENMELLRKLADLGDIEERKEYKNAILSKLRYGTYKEFLNVMKYHFDYLTENEQEAFLSKPGKKFIERVEKEFGECDIDKDKEWKYDWIELIEKMK